MSPRPDTDGAFFYVLNQPVKIIYVDDDPILREFARASLASEHASVATAADGIEALQCLEAFEPDIMLLDLEMPRMDGFEVLDRLRASQAWRDLPVIVATGRDDVSAIDRAFQAGATDFVVKPLSWRLLSYQIRYVMRSSRAATCPPGASELSADVSQMERLASEGARFLALAVERDPSLRSAAVAFARVAETMLHQAHAERAA